MYFHKKNSKIHLNLKGDLILSHNPQLIRAKYKSCAPRYVTGGHYIEDVNNLSMRAKIKVIYAVARFIFSDKSQALVPMEIESE